MTNENKSFYDMVHEFQGKFGVNADIQSDKPEIPSIEVFMFKWRHIKEELDEMGDAFDDKNLEEMADALVDVVYVILGLAVAMNLPYDKLFKAVHEANMRKVRVNHAEESKRNSSFDIIKPLGWKAADIKSLLIEAGANL